MVWTRLVLGGLLCADLLAEPASAGFYLAGLRVMPARRIAGARQIR